VVLEVTVDVPARDEFLNGRRPIKGPYVSGSDSFCIAEMAGTSSRVAGLTSKGWGG
jgi:hypothetical protein